MRAARRSAIAAVASRAIERATTYAREWEIPRAHGSYDALLRDPEVDAVYIPLPNSLHVEWTLRAVDAGKHVLCEKPLALTPQDIDRIIVVAKARERIVTEAFMFRHEAMTTRMLELLRDDAIGPVQTISSGFTFDLNRTPDVRLDPALGGGSLWDVGCYAVAAARLVAGEPREAFGWATRGPSGVDESFNGVLRFDNNVIATIHSSFRASYRIWLEIAGRDAVMRVPNPFKPAAQDEIELHRGTAMQRIPVTGSPVMPVRMIEDFVAAVIDGRPPVINLAESRGNAAALAALYEAARTGLLQRI
jgi:xylose dehydrogenase (NAD/NADP)